MSSNHKAPLAAFVVVAIACVVVLATNSMRSYARDAWHTLAAPVVSGLSLHGEPAVAAPVATEPAAQRSERAPVVPAAPTVAAGPALHQRHHREHRSLGGVHEASGANHARTTHVTVPTPAPTTRPAITPPPATPQAHGHLGPDHGTHAGWTQGKHQGWTKGDHGSASATRPHGSQKKAGATAPAAVGKGAHGAAKHQAVGPGSQGHGAAKGSARGHSGHGNVHAASSAHGKSAGKGNGRH